jgi:ketosteroid isomerase-like protein
MPDPDEELVEANAAFYNAFERRDLDAMSEVWLHEDHVVCTHPGWASLHGWPAVAASWFALFQGDHPMQFILTKVTATVRGDTGWVTVDENLIAGPQAQTVAAVNLFERHADGWKLVLHAGSGIADG